MSYFRIGGIIHNVVNKLDPVFNALADQTRREVLQLLGSGPMQASDLASETGMARNAMSRHLGILRNCGLVTVELSTTDARRRMYRLQGERLAEVSQWCDQIEAEWQDQLKRFRRFTERSQAR